MKLFPKEYVNFMREHKNVMQKKKILNTIAIWVCFCVCVCVSVSLFLPFQVSPHSRLQKLILSNQDIKKLVFTFDV